ncbi:MAG: M48 family metalloprotease [Myxococcales bacterium]|nr:M48 family metalloprotease [Myxococcales bacterium]
MHHVRAARYHLPHVDGRSLLLLAGMIATAAFAGFVSFGLLGVFIASGLMLVLGSSAMTIPTHWVMRLQGARPVQAWEKPGLARLVGQLAARAGIRAPALYLIPSAEPNALASGGPDGDGAIAVTPGLLRALDGRELAGVLAHEVVHLRRNDTALVRLGSVAASAAATTLRLALWATFFGMLLFGHASLARLGLLLVLSLFLPTALTLLATALSRSRELSADAEAARITGDPLGLAAALARIDRVQRFWSSLLMGRMDVPAALRSHPPTEERVRRLRAMAFTR